jgi:hypothetical protein
MRIDQNKLPAKYALEVYKMVDGFPSTIDILYEIVTILQARDRLTQPFQAKDLLKEVTTRIQGEDLQDTLPKLASEGWLRQDGETYYLDSHPWMETKVTE